MLRVALTDLGVVSPCNRECGLFIYLFVGNFFCHMDVLSFRTQKARSEVRRGSQMWDWLLNCPVTSSVKAPALFVLCVGFLPKTHKSVFHKAYVASAFLLKQWSHFMKTICKISHDKNNKVNRIEKWNVPSRCKWVFLRPLNEYNISSDQHIHYL